MTRNRGVSAEPVEHRPQGAGELRGIPKKLAEVSGVDIATYDGGGVVLDMFPHWNYVLENLFGKVQAVTAKAVTHIPERWDEQGRKYAATATLAQALDIAERFDAADVGVVVDTFTCGGNRGLPTSCSAPDNASSATRSATGLRRCRRTPCLLAG
jgi:hypothetical protein